MTNMIAPQRPDRSWASRWGAVSAVLAISLVATGLVWQFEEQRMLEDGQLRFERGSQLLKEDILNTMKAYAQFLRGGVGLVHASESVSRDAWYQYVEDARLPENYPGIQGVSINGFLRGQAELQAFVARTRQNDWPEYQVSPDSALNTYAPVLFLEPLSDANERAIGFDVYSEELRRTAVDRAVASGEPVVTAKITLIQEQDYKNRGGVQAGVLLILPTYEAGVQPASATERRDATTGLIVSVFRIGDLVNSVYAARGETPQERIRLHLYDAKTKNSEAQLFGDTFEDARSEHQAMYNSSLTLDVYGRPWTLQTFSTQAFEDEVYSESPKIVLGTGILLSLLLTSLVLGQSQRAYETELTSDKLAMSQQQIELLMGEVNHRSKNLLSLVQAIARQTRSDDPSLFVSQFSERVRALAASQDLLVKNSWKGISLHDLVDSQLAHFDGLLGDRIQVNGPDIDVSAEASQTLGMAFHELATNAGKYGALSNSVGMVDIEWRIETGVGVADRLKLTWLESGGPPVVEPLSKGFGTKVTDMMVKYALNGQVECLFKPAGFVWRLSCPTSRVFEDPSDPISMTMKDRKTAV